jgi:hypothetical protein
MAALARTHLYIVLEVQNTESEHFKLLFLVGLT